MKKRVLRRKRTEKVESGSRWWNPVVGVEADEEE